MKFSVSDHCDILQGAEGKKAGSSSGVSLFF